MVAERPNTSNPRKRIFLILILAVGLVGATVLLLRVYRKREIKAYRIAAILPMTGDAKSYGPLMKNGMIIAQQQVTASGDLPIPIEVVFADSESSAEGGERAFKRLVDVEGVDAVVTTTTPVTKALIPLANAKGIVLFTSATAPGLVDGSPWAFRNASNYKDEVERLLDVVQPDLKLKKIGLVYLNNGVGQWLNSNFKRVSSDHGATLVESVSFEKGATDFHAQIQKLKAASPDAVYLYGYNELGLLAKQMRELGLNAQLLGGLDMDLPEFIDIGKNAVEGAIYTKSEYNPTDPDPVSKNFVDAYKTAYGVNPDVYGAVHYDIVMILAKAFREAGHDREKMRQAILSLKNFHGASGVTNFGPSNDASKPIAVKMIRNGQHASYSR